MDLPSASKCFKNLFKQSNCSFYSLLILYSLYYFIKQNYFLKYLIPYKIRLTQASSKIILLSYYSWFIIFSKKVKIPGSNWSVAVLFIPLFLPRLYYLHVVFSILVFFEIIVEKIHLTIKRNCFQVYTGTKNTFSFFYLYFCRPLNENRCYLQEGVNKKPENQKLFIKLTDLLSGCNNVARM